MGISGKSAALAVVLWAALAQAQATRTWVSGVGDDVNPCSRTAPCKTFAGAISKTAAGGEISVLDSAGFGGVTITKAITIDGHGAHGSVLVATGNGITISAGANDVVRLRDLSITGIGLGTTGVRINTAKSVVIESCSIRDFTQHGIDLSPTGATQLMVRESVISNVDAGIRISGGQAVVAKSALTASLTGVHALGDAGVTLFDSVISNNRAGVYAQGTSQVTLDRGAVSGNGTGIQSESTVRVSDVMVSNNGVGLSGPVTSFGNNRLNAGNTTNGTPTATVSQQ